MFKFINKKFLGILVSLIFIGIIASQIDLKETVNSFGLMNPIYILPIIPIYIMSFVLRAFRWRIFLCNDGLKFNSLLSSIFIGFSLNCVLPARAGEIYRAYFFSKKENLTKTKVFTSVILERIFDGLTLFIILLAAICLLCPGALFLNIAASAGLIFLGGFISLLILVKVQKSGNKREKIKLFLLKFTENFHPKIQKLIKILIIKVFSILNSFIEGLITLNSYKSLLKSIFFSFLIWLTEGAFTLLVIKSFGVDISLLGALLVLAVMAFSTLIPAGPAGIGPYQWGYIVALKVFGVTPELGLAISIMNQILSIIIILSAGLLFAWKDHIKLDDIQQKLQETQSFSS